MKSMLLSVAFFVSACGQPIDSPDLEPDPVAESSELLADVNIETAGDGSVTFRGRGVAAVSLRGQDSARFIAVEFERCLPIDAVTLVQTSYGSAVAVPIGPSQSGHLTSYVAISDAFGFVDPAAKTLRVQLAAFGQSCD